MKDSENFHISFSKKSLNYTMPEALERAGLDLDTATPLVALEFFSRLVFKEGKKIPSRRITPYTSKDKLKAVKTLRNFTIYANEFESIFLTAGVGARGKEKPTKEVPLIIEQLDQMEKDLALGASIKKKKTWKREVSLLEKRINKVFSNCLGLTEQNALAKIVEKSLKALKGLYRFKSF